MDKKEPTKEVVSEVVEEDEEPGIPSAILNDVDLCMEAYLFQKATMAAFENETEVTMARVEIGHYLEEIASIQKSIDEHQKVIDSFRSVYATDIQGNDDRMVATLEALKVSWGTAAEAGWEVGRTRLFTRQGDEVEIERKVTKTVIVDDVEKMAAYLIKTGSVEKGMKTGATPFIAKFVRKIIEAKEDLGLDVPPGMAHLEPTANVYVRPQKKEEVAG